jgi:hypothetical protein
MMIRLTMADISDPPNPPRSLYVSAAHIVAVCHGVRDHYNFVIVGNQPRDYMIRESVEDVVRQWADAMGWKVP